MVEAQVTLLRVLAAQAALGVDGKGVAMQECRAELCALMTEELNDQIGIDPYGAKYLFGMHDVIGKVGYYQDGSSRASTDEAVERFFNVKPDVLREYELIDEVTVAVARLHTYMVC